MSFKEKYGTWAFVAGGSEGMGGAFCDRLAKEGMNVVVTGRHAEKIANKQKQLEADFGVATRGLTIDFGDDEILPQVKAATDDLEIGFLVYNVGLASMALFTERDIDFELYRLNANTKSMLTLSLHFSKQMKERGKGGIILLSSSGGVVGSPYIQTYSATKAYAFTLAEALWGELSDFGIDVLAILPGNTIGQNFAEVAPGTPSFQTGAEVVEEAFQAFGVDPTVICGDYTRQEVGDNFNIPKRKEQILKFKAAMQALQKDFGTGNDTKG
ncbi:SDR family NAD(P)-dependent oxidoreductase [Enterococcus sp. HY326]|uniref:SDR family NAD(P)-dependent oxidoreductase n=1 Tax=Enterococcus sp. HY326 TaxID=2971265 RepID=UPI0022406A83|nr:SDR family NAD(P)-dependent oxidoreductase [Enterococcus sp. HY326]